MIIDGFPCHQRTQRGGKVQGVIPREPVCAHDDTRGQAQFTNHNEQNVGFVEENHRGNLERSHRAIFCDSRPCDCAGRVGLKKTALTAPTCRATGAILTRAAGGMITASGVTPSSQGRNGGEERASFGGCAAVHRRLRKL